MKMKSLLLTSLCSLVAASLGAAEKQMPPKRVVNGCCPPPCPCGVSARDPDWLITPAVYPAKTGADCPGAYFTADFIWWKTHLGGTEWVFDGITDQGGLVTEGTNPKPGHIRHADFEFEPGFKVGAGVFFAHDGWDLYGNYTWLHQDAEVARYAAKEGTGNLAILGTVVKEDGEDGTPEVIAAGLRWKQYFNVVDLELGRNFFISRYLTMRPHFGLKWANIREHLSTTGLGILNSDLIDYTQTYGQNMWGIGARAGLDTVWRFTENWGIYGDIAGTALWSDFHVNEVMTSIGVQPAFPGVVTWNTKEVVLQVIPVFEFGLGLQYMTFVGCNCDYYIQFSAGWEAQIWCDFNQIFYNHPTRSGNLSVHGLTAKAEFAF